MAYTQADLDRIDAELAKVESEIQFGDRRVKKRTIDELQRQREIIAVALSGSTTPKTRCTLTTFRKD